MPGVPLPSLPTAFTRFVHFKRSRLRWPERVVAASATVFLLALFLLSWFTFTSTSGGAGTKYFVQYSKDGWNCLPGLRWLFLVTLLVAFALVILQAARRGPAVPVALSLFTMLLAGASAIALFIRVIIVPPGGREAGGWVALVAAVVLTWAGYRSVRMEGIAPGDGPDIPSVTLSEVEAELGQRRDQPPSEHS